MSGRIPKCRLLVTLAVGAIAFVGAGSPIKAAASTPAVGGSFVGKIAGTKVLIAVVADERKAGAAKRSVRAYFCDDTKTFQWFIGDAASNSITLRSTTSDAHLSLKLKTSGASGTVTLPGFGKKTFAAAPATGVAGLYVGSVTAEGVMSGRSATGARIEGKAESPTSVAGQMLPVQGNPVPFTFKGSDLLSVNFRLIVDPSGDVRGARAEKNVAHGFQLWEQAS